MQYAVFDSEWDTSRETWYLAVLYDHEGHRAVFANREAARQALERLPEDLPVAAHYGHGDWDQLDYRPSKVLDTGVLAWLVDERPPHGLKELSRKYLHNNPMEPLVRRKGKVYWNTVWETGKPPKLSDLIPLSEAPTSETLQYCVSDVLTTHRLARFLLNVLSPRLQEWYWTIEEPLDRVVWEMQRTGFAVDVDKLEGMRLPLEAKAAEAQQRVFDAIGYEFNTRSPHQLGQVLFTKTYTVPVRKYTQVGYYKTCVHKVAHDKCPHKCPLRPKFRKVLVEEPRQGLGLKPPRQTTSTGKPQVTAETLSLLPVHPVVNNLREHRLADKLLTTYVEPLLRKQKNGRIHARFNSTGTATGRFSSAGPNLQNIPVRTPEGKQVRDCFIAGRGHRLLVSDLVQIEYKLLAAFSQEPALLEAFRIGEDVHQHTANMYGVSRDTAKLLNYAEVYGAGVQKLSRLLGISVNEVKHLQDQYASEMPRVKEWKDRVIRYGRRHGYIITVGRRRRHLPDLRSADEKVRARAERQAVNSVIQGSAADLIRVTMALNPAPFGAKLVAQVHDELVHEVHIEHAAALEAEVRAAFSESALFLGITRVPILVNCHVVERWGSAK